MQSRLNMVWWLHQQLRRSLRFRNLESNQGREKIEETQQCWMVTQIPQRKVNWIHNPQSIQFSLQSSAFWLLSNHLTVHQYEDKEAVKMSQKSVQYYFKIIPIYAKNQKKITWTAIWRDERPWFWWWCSMLGIDGYWRTNSHETENEDCEKILNPYCQKSWKRIFIHESSFHWCLCYSTKENLVKKSKASKMRRSEMIEIHQWLSHWCFLRLMVMNCLYKNKEMILFYICQRLKK